MFQPAQAGGQQFTSQSSSSMLQPQLMGGGMRTSRKIAGIRQGELTRVDELNRLWLWLEVRLIEPAGRRWRQLPNISTQQKRRSFISIISTIVPISHVSPTLTFTSSCTFNNKVQALPVSSFNNCPFLLSYSFLSRYPTLSSMSLSSFSTRGSISQKSEQSVARQRAHLYFCSVLLREWIHRIQKVCPHGRVVGWVISYRQMLHPSSSSYMQSPTSREEMPFFFPFLSDFILSNLSMTCFLICPRESGCIFFLAIGFLGSFLGCLGDFSTFCWFLVRIAFILILSS